MVIYIPCYPRYRLSPLCPHYIHLGYGHLGVCFTIFRHTSILYIILFVLVIINRYIYIYIYTHNHSTSPCFFHQIPICSWLNPQFSLSMWAGRIKETHSKYLKMLSIYVISQCCCLYPHYLKWPFHLGPRIKCFTHSWCSKSTAWGPTSMNFRSQTLAATFIWMSWWSNVL